MCRFVTVVAIGFIWLLCLDSARGELPVLEPFVESLKQELQTQIGDSQVVVSVRLVGKGGWPWAVHEALASEITAALRADKVDAITAASDHRIESLAESKLEFAAADAKRIKSVDRSLLVTGSLQTTVSPPQLKLAVWNAESGAVQWSKDVEVPADVMKLEANVPELNRKVVAFCRENIDKKVADGICATLAGEALAAAGAKRSGVYTWGRELDDREPILPGDILQLELIEMKSPGFSRKFHHHTVVVEESRPDALVILQQNVRPKGQIVQRDTWPLVAFKRGYLVAYRPWMGSSSLPPVSPRRRTPSTIVKKGQAIDLLHTLNPRLDSVKGIWFLEEGNLRPNRDTWARLQVPLEPPDKYTLRLKVKRLVGSNTFGVGLVVGGRQTMVAFDAYDAPVSGLHLVDGKTCKNNPTTYKGTVLPIDKVVNLRIQVTPESVTGEADGKPIISWKGNASRLGQDEKYAMPHTDWLFLASWNSHLAISEFLLDDDSAGGKQTK
ncbi:MAG: hypothetical protein AABP62_27620 [Planctomycetota bacterium]